MRLDPDSERLLQRASIAQRSWISRHSCSLQAVTVSHFGTVYALSARKSYVIERSGRVTTRLRGRPGLATRLVFLAE
jgi:hypothetical protein